MEIINSITPMNDIEALAANGQKLRVAVTKTSAQGKAAQSTTPNLMSFSTDENSVWFNGKKHGVHLFKDSIYTLSTSSSHQDIVNALNGLDNSNIKSFVDTGVIGVFRLDESPDYYQGIVTLGYEEEEPIHMHLYITDNYYNTKYISINISTPTKYVVEAVEDSSLLRETDVANSLTLTSTTRPLSAAMGKKLQDEKLAKSDVVNNLTTTDASKALSAAQGKALNDRISGLGNVYRIKGNKTNISEVLALTDAKVGDVWNVTNAFTLNGKPFPASTNIVCVTATSSSDHDEGNWDPIGGTVDLSPYAKKTEVEKGDDEIWEQLGKVVNKDEIVNNLTSTDTNKPLSAAMGKKLNDEKISKSEIVNNLVTSDPSKPLSAAQGKKLQDEKLSKTDASNTYLTKTSAESTYAKKADEIPHYSIGELTVLSSNPTQEQLKTALGTPSAFRGAIDAGKLILVTGNANVQSQKLATCIIDSGNVIVKYLYPGNNDWTVIAKCVPASSDGNWDNAQFNVRIIKPLESAGIIIE